MTVAIAVEDEAWNAIPEIAHLTRSTIAATFGATGVAEADFDTSIVFSDDAAMAALNGKWRGKPHATNVLSFPAEAMPLPAGEAKPLGDIILASGVVAREAAGQGKSLPDHTTHLIIHGLLHLLGYDHEDDGEAREMEGLETEILKGLGISDPYERH